MYYITDDISREHTYPTYGRQFLAYRWYKPILVGVLFAIFYTILALALFMGTAIANGVATGAPDLDPVLNALTGSYDEMDLADPIKAVMDLGGNAIMIPALFLAAVIVRDRPFSSYSSARGGWNHTLFWRIIPIAFLCKGIPILVEELIFHRQYNNFDVRFTLLSFVLVTILGPLQCIAEEYLFRGLLMQTLGSWLRIPVIAVILQSVAFAAMHPYNNIGKAAILVSGLTFGLAAWICRGIEGSSALHVVNNMTIFYLNGLSMCEISADVSMYSLVEDLVTGIVFLLILFILRRKTDWFNAVKKDDLGKANKKYSDKMARKSMRKAMKRGESVDRDAFAAAEGKFFVVEGNDPEPEIPESSDEDAGGVQLRDAGSDNEPAPRAEGGKHFRKE